MVGQNFAARSSVPTPVLREHWLPVGGKPTARIIAVDLAITSTAMLLRGQTRALATAQMATATTVRPAAQIFDTDNAIRNFRLLEQLCAEWLLALLHGFLTRHARLPNSLITGLHFMMQPACTEQPKFRREMMKTWLIDF
jgi:hypothetical protein